MLLFTNTIESLNARYRRAGRARRLFPTEQAALKTLHLVTRGMDPKDTGQARWTMRRKPALNAFALTFADRMSAAENLQQDERQKHRSSDSPALRRRHPPPRGRARCTRRIGILHGYQTHGKPYDERAAWAHHQPAALSRYDPGVSRSHP